ncbi:MAG: DUF5675 family protein [Syntrophomonas sp.]
MKAVLSREYGNIQTLGRLVLFEGNQVKLQLCTLELPDLGNQKNISCIPEGKYEVHRIYSPKFGKCFHVQEVPGRSEILIHKGNYNKDTHGCILIGLEYADINEDGMLDVIESTRAMEKLQNAITTDQFELIII